MARRKTGRTGHGLASGLTGHGCATVDRTGNVYLSDDDARWRAKRATEKQRRALARMGVDVFRKRLTRGRAADMYQEACDRKPGAVEVVVEAVRAAGMDDASRGQALAVLRDMLRPMVDRFKSDFGVPPTTAEFDADVFNSMVLPAMVGPDVRDPAELKRSMMGGCRALLGLRISVPTDPQTPVAVSGSVDGETLRIAT